MSRNRDSRLSGKTDDMGVEDWSWGKVAHQIVQARAWMESGAWDIPTQVAA